MAEVDRAVGELQDKSLLLLDDDAALRNRLGRALEARGFATSLAQSVSEAVVGAWP